MATHKIFETLDIAKVDRNGIILEIGSQRSPGHGSSYKLSQLADSLSMKFMTVDFSEQTFKIAKNAVGDKAYLSDGVEFINQLSSPISILYLDNFDVIYSPVHAENLHGRIGNLYEDKGFDVSDHVKQNILSAETHLAQAKAALLKLTSRAFIAIDDTKFKENGKFWWGKGALVVPFLLIAGFKIVATTDSGLALSNFDV